MSFSSKKMYLGVHTQNYRTAIKLYDIKFRKTGEFKYLKSIIPENDDYGSEIKKKV